VQKWIGGSVVALVLFGLFVAFVASPIGPRDPTAPRNSASSTSELVAPQSAPLAIHNGAIKPRLTVKRPSIQSIGTSLNVAKVDGDQNAATLASGDKADDHPLGKGITVEQDKDEPHAQHHVSDADNGSTVKLSVGQSVAIRLKENRTTGFGWKLENPSNASKQGVDAVPPHMELVYDKSHRGVGRSSAGRQLVGVPGQHVFVLKATSIGRSEICAAYRRPWESVATPAGQIYCVFVDVTEH